MHIKNRTTAATAGCSQYHFLLLLLEHSKKTSRSNTKRRLNLEELTLHIFWIIPSEDFFPFISFVLYHVHSVRN